MVAALAGHSQMWLYLLFRIQAINTIWEHIDWATADHLGVALESFDSVSPFINYEYIFFIIHWQSLISIEFPMQLF